NPTTHLVPLPPGGAHGNGPSFGSAIVSGRNTPIALPSQTSAPSAPRMQSTGQLASAAPNVPACTQQSIRNAGGPIIANPRVNIVFWGNWSSADYQPIVNQWSALASMPVLYTRLAEYGIGNGSWGNYYLYTAGATGSAGSPVSLTDATITTAIESLIGTPTSNDVYIALLPNQYTTSSNDGNSPNRGHHRNLFYGNNIDLRWGVIGSNAFILMAHELSEAFTDPDYFTGSHAWDDSNSGPGVVEVGDPCDPGNLNNYMAGYYVRQVWSQSACRCVKVRDIEQGDALANGTADETVYRPSTTHFYGLNSYHWGIGESTDVTYNGDFDGDGRTEWALFRPSTGNIFELHIVPGVYYTFNWGNSSDTPAPGDYDGDGKSDLAVWNPNDGWRIQQSSNGATASQSWGLSGDIPIAGDYDGDFKTDYAVFRPSNGTWYILPSSLPGTVWTESWNATYGDTVIPKDFNGDGVTDIAYWHQGTFFVAYSLGNGNNGTSSNYSLSWGLSGDIPVVADYDGDWLADPTVWRPSNGNWYITKSSTWTTTSVQWGDSGDKPNQRNLLP
ncbi:MAG: FG-GAP repeat domain-containing protein, partial [Polyangiaceae bacterium]